MPHDRKGQLLQKGDRVTFTATVQEVFEGETACNATFVVDANPDAPEETYQPQISCNTKLVEKVES